MRTGAIVWDMGCELRLEAESSNIEVTVLVSTKEMEASQAVIGMISPDDCAWSFCLFEGGEMSATLPFPFPST